MTLKAAFFEARADYFGRPFDDGILRALLAAGFEVDLFAPEGELPQTLYPPTVRRRSVEYRRRWLQRHMRRRLWREYDLFLGTADLPMAFAGVLAKLAGRPSVVACDEIYIGGYEGMATAYWKPLTQWAMRRAAFTIITDPVRIPLQRAYASLAAGHEFVTYPSGYAFPYAGHTRDEARAAIGAAEGELILSATGAFTHANGCDWIVRFIGADPSRAVRALIQTGGTPEPVLDALLASLPRAIYLPARLPWIESMEVTVGADLAAVLYLSQKPEFQAMGVSSQKLCTALWLGIPVVATRQPSFAFIEERRCGLLVDGEREFPAAVERIRSERDELAANALRTFREFVRPEEHLAELTARFRSFR